MKKKRDIIILAGAPGSGKTTIANLLKAKLDAPLIDFGDLRIFHLDKGWKKANKREEEMAFENLVFILKNYIKKKYKNIIVTDLLYDKVARLSRIFSNKIIIITLVVEDKELIKRVVNPKRDSGFRNEKLALKYNDEWKTKKELRGEIKIDNSSNNIHLTLGKIMKIINHNGR